MAGGMRAPTFYLGGWSGINPKIRTPYLRALTYALAEMDLAWLRENRDVPMLYDSGVRYERQPPGEEMWRDIKATLDAMGGDCKCLAAWRTAELRLDGIDARPIVSVKPIMRNGRRLGNLFHVKVGIYRDGILYSEEDPSRRLGM